MEQVHELKILPFYFEPIKARKKTFEIRKNDRNFQLGDYVWFRECDPAFRGYSGQFILVQIVYLLDEMENKLGTELLKTNYVAFSFKIVTPFLCQLCGKIFPESHIMPGVGYCLVCCKNEADVYYDREKKQKTRHEKNNLLHLEIINRSK